ncbi:MAG: hypothetical protein ACJATT_000314 [Myxococcota bacterium]|jgi:hypothetical protein
MLSAPPPWDKTVTRYILTGGLLLLALPAHAVDVDFAGYYRARARAFQSLSIETGEPDSEASSIYVQHRFLMRPTFYVNDNVMVSADIRGLENVAWGDSPAPAFDFEQGADELVVTTDNLQPPSDTALTNGAANIQLWRAWSEVRFGDHTLRFGRMPLNWGSGIWWNDGLGRNAEYGDTADRIQWEGLFGDIYASAAIDVNSEALFNATDDTTAFNALGAYRSETITAGAAVQLRHTVHADGAEPFTVATIDLSFDAEIGKIEIHGEGVARFGGGDLSIDDTAVNIAAGGAILEGGVGFDFAKVGLVAGVATGDSTIDNTRTTFTFDRDYNVGLLMFEQPLPTFAIRTESGEIVGRSFDQVASGNAVSNALFLKPRIQRNINDQFEVEASLLWARVLAAPSAGRESYGFEFNAGANYIGTEHVDIGLSGAIFLPGSYYSEIADRDLSQPVFGAQLLGRVVF